MDAAEARFISAEKEINKYRCICEKNIISRLLNSALTALYLKVFHVIVLNAVPTMVLSAIVDRTECRSHVFSVIL